MVDYVIIIQFSEKTGRYHPAFYRPLTFPGPDNDSIVTRYMSGNVHSKGFEEEFPAQQSAMRLATQLSVEIPESGCFEIRDVIEAGIDSFEEVMSLDEYNEE